jgi:hypothetical protein
MKRAANMHKLSTQLISVTQLSFAAKSRLPVIASNQFHAKNRELWMLAVG